MSAADPDAEEAATLPRMLKSTLARRVASIIHAATHSGSIDQSALLARLTDLEQGLFAEGQAHEAARRRWRAGLSAAPSHAAGRPAAAAGSKKAAAGGAGGGGFGVAAVSELHSVTGVGYKRQRQGVAGR